MRINRWHSQWIIRRKPLLYLRITLLFLKFLLQVKLVKASQKLHKYKFPLAFALHKSVNLDNLVSIIEECPVFDLCILLASTKIHWLIDSENYDILNSNITLNIYCVKLKKVEFIFSKFYTVTTNWYCCDILFNVMVL